MNREIKFRAWDKEGEIMIYYSPYLNGYLKFNGKVFEIDKEGCDVELFDLVPMQYTGLKDKNKVEIYFDDLVIWAGQKTPVRVEWKDQRICPYLNETTEVVGNIYENKELLNK